MKNVNGIITGVIILALINVLTAVEAGLSIKKLDILIYLLIGFCLLIAMGLYLIYSNLLATNNDILCKAGKRFLLCFVCILATFFFMIILMAANFSIPIQLLLFVTILTFGVCYIWGMYLLHQGLGRIAAVLEDSWMITACSRSWMIFLIMSSFNAIISSIFQYTGYSKSTIILNWILQGLEIITGIFMFVELIRILFYMKNKIGELNQQCNVIKVKLWSIKNIGARDGFISVALLLAIVSIGYLTTIRYSDQYDFEYKTYYDVNTKTYNENAITLTKYTNNRSTVVIPAEIDGKLVYEVGDELFHNNLTIENVRIESGVKYIGNDAFSRATNLSNIEIPDSVSSIGVGAFEYCPKLELLELPSSLETISQNTFFNTGLKVIIIPGNVKTIEKDAFFSCNSLETITMEDGVETIDSEAFYGCEALETVKLPNSLTVIGDSAFMECTMLENVTIPDSVTDISSNSFSNTSWMDNQNDDFIIVGNGVLLRYTGNHEEVIVPEDVKIIGNRAFGYYESSEEINDNYRNTKKIILHDDISSIGDFAFDGCVALEEITIPNGVYHIGEGAFEDCKSLNTIKLPDGIGEIESALFRNCVKLSNISLPSDLSFIPYQTFYGCTSLKKIEIPVGITEIGYEAFGNCSNLKKVTIPETVNYIRYNAFRGTPWFDNNTEEFWIVGDGVLIKYNGINSNYTDLRIPKGVKVLPAGVLGELPLFRSITIPEGVEKIDDKFVWNNVDNATTIGKIIVLEPSITVSILEDDYKGILSGHKDSETEKYAKEKGITFELVN